MLLPLMSAHLTITKLLSVLFFLSISQIFAILRPPVGEGVPGFPTENLFRLAAVVWISFSTLLSSSDCTFITDITETLLIILTPVKPAQFTQFSQYCQLYQKPYSQSNSDPIKNGGIIAKYSLTAFFTKAEKILAKLAIKCYHKHNSFCLHSFSKHGKIIEALQLI
jgi:hypothetical protein